MQSVVTAWAIFTTPASQTEPQMEVNGQLSESMHHFLSLDLDFLFYPHVLPRGVTEIPPASVETRDEDDYTKERWR